MYYALQWFTRTDIEVMSHDWAVSEVANPFTCPAYGENLGNVPLDNNVRQLQSDNTQTLDYHHYIPLTSSQLTKAWFGGGGETVTKTIEYKVTSQAPWNIRTCIYTDNPWPSLFLEGRVKQKQAALKQPRWITPHTISWKCCHTSHQQHAPPSGLQCPRELLRLSQSSVQTDPVVSIYINGEVQCIHLYIMYRNVKEFLLPSQWRTLHASYEQPARGFQETAYTKHSWDKVLCCPPRTD
jgi:hypothetical protein